MALWPCVLCSMQQNSKKEQHEHAWCWLSSLHKQ